MDAINIASKTANQKTAEATANFIGIEIVSKFTIKPKSLEESVRRAKKKRLSINGIICLRRKKYAKTKNLTVPRTTIGKITLSSHCVACNNKAIDLLNN